MDTLGPAILSLTLKRDLKVWPYREVKCGFIERCSSILMIGRKEKHGKNRESGLRHLCRVKSFKAFL